MKMKNIKLFIVLGLLILIGLVSYFVSVKKPTSESANWEVYRNEVDKVSFRFPNGFREAVNVGEQGAKGSRAYFTNYKELDYLISGLPPDGGAHIGYISLPYNRVEFDEYIRRRTPSGSDPKETFYKTETTVAGLPAIRIAQESTTNNDPNKIQKEITYLMHDEDLMYQFLIEYFKGDPNSAKLEADFETMMKTIMKI